MGRNRKMGLDYFPFDIDTFQDIKIRKLIKYQGGKAITIYALLLCFIYKDGYYMRWDKELPFIISEQTGFEEAYISEVIKSCLTLGLFSKELFDTEQVLTSKGIQSRYRDICKQIKRKCDFSEYSLISSEENDISSEEIPVSSEEKPINSAKSTQKKIKGKENIAIDFPSEEEKSSFPSNEEKASNAREGKVEVSGNSENSENGDFGGLGEQSLAAEIETENGFANKKKNALVGEAGQETEIPPMQRERKFVDLTKEKNKADELLTSDSENVSEAKKSAKSRVFQQEKIPYQEIVDLFNSICLDYPKVVKLSDARKNKIRIRVEEMGGFARAKPIIQTIFEKMQASKFMRGDNKRGWKAYFDWIFENGKNWVKILEGNYDNSNKNSGAHSATDSDAEFMRNIAEGIARANFEKQQRRNGSESL